MPSLSRRRAGAATLFAIFALMSGSALAEYPDKPVKIIVPFNAGGPTDVTARLVAEGLSKRLGAQFYVENLTGAGGNTGTAQAGRSPPDGYTLLVASTGSWSTRASMPRYRMTRERILRPSPSSPLHRTFGW